MKNLFEQSEMNEEKNTILENRRWIILSIAILIFVVIAEDVLEQERFAFDSIIYHFIFIFIVFDNVSSIIIMT